jgi:hypothetical protein
VSRPARTLYVFAIYLALMALTLLFAPNLLLRLVGMPETTEVWIRVVGMLVGFLALCYYVAVRTEARPIMWASVLARLCALLFFTVFVIAGWVDWVLILFGVVDALAALWTWRALRAPVPDQP